MFSLVSRASSVALAAFLGAIVIPAARAADMPFFSPPAEAPEQPVEWGSGWYLRGDVGFTDTTAPVIFANILNGNPKHNAMSGGGGVGYQVNNWFRTEIAVDRQVFRRDRAGASIWCPYSAHPLTDPGNPTSTPPIPPTNLGGGVDPNETCTPFSTTHMQRTSGFLNGYVDLGNWYGFTPYLGGGVGVSLFRTNASQTYYKNSDGSLYAPDLSVGMNGFPLIWVNKFNGVALDPQPFIPFAPINWNSSLSKTSWKFAWNLMAGVSYDISQNLKVDVGYRYLNAGAFTSFVTAGPNPFIQPVTKSITSHEIRLGLRLTAD